MHASACLLSFTGTQHTSENEGFSDTCPLHSATLPFVTLLAVGDLESGPERLLAELSEAAERVEDYAGRSKSAATVKAYASGWRDFLDFCAERELSSLPASDPTVARDLSHMA